MMTDIEPYPVLQTIDGKETRVLRHLERSQGEEKSLWLFVSERRSPLTDHTVRKIIPRGFLGSRKTPDCHQGFSLPPQPVRDR
jgi:hypothetical protein